MIFYRGFGDNAVLWICTPLGPGEHVGDTTCMGQSRVSLTCVSGRRSCGKLVDID